MAIVMDTVSIKGLRATHFEQLFHLLKRNERDGEYYGNRAQYDKRHAELKEWLESLIDLAREPDVIIPKKEQ